MKNSLSLPKLKTFTTPLEQDKSWRQRIKEEQSDYLKSIKASLDLGIIRQVPVTKEAFENQRLSQELSQSLNAESFINAASYTFRGVRGQPSEGVGMSILKEKGKIAGFLSSRPSIFGEQSLTKMHTKEAPLREVKYKETYFAGTNQHMAVGQQHLINKDYEVPRYGDGQAIFKHPTYLPNHPSKKSEINLEHQEVIRAPISTRRIASMKVDDLEPRVEFLKHVEFEANKGFATMRKSDTYRDELDKMSKRIVLHPKDLEILHKPFQWQEQPRQNPQLHYKSPIVSRRHNINQIRYDDSVYASQSNSPLKMMTEEYKNKSVVYQDYLSKRQSEVEERMAMTKKFKLVQ